MRPADQLDVPPHPYLKPPDQSQAVVGPFLLRTSVRWH